MTISTPEPPTTGVAAYGLALPTLDQARDALTRVYGADAAGLWSGLLATAGVTASAADDRETLERVLAAMTRSPDPVVALCGTSLAIRLTSFVHLSAAHSAIRRSEQ